ncbi:protein kinase [bacterium]|nr:protein kinase [bacterium]
MTRSHRPDEVSIWDKAEDDENRRRARVFEQEWHRSKGLGGRRPSLSDYLPKPHADRPAALLALIRVDMACRKDCGDVVRVEDYLSLGEPALKIPEVLAGLAFEEYMLRVEAGERPRWCEYESRFADAGDSLKDLILIQEAFAGFDDDTAVAKRTSQWEGFPEVGDRIEGFQLIEELGTGSFSRVFLAQDVELAGRQVAVKVSHGRCAEWLTLARLQHTNIVPIHSHAKTILGERSFDLVCMPYFGRVTLDAVIEHNQWSLCLDGGEIQALLDGLQSQALIDESKDSSSRRHLTSLSFDQAVAWWGSILAEALRHAHERHVLHRDIKPSNILITPGCEPMLLDFNLSYQRGENRPGESREGETTGKIPNAENVGGTLAYMAPEHIEAMLTGQSRLVDQRADIYALGAVLYEALTRRSGVNKSNIATGSRDELLRQTLELRRIPVPPLRDIAPDVTPALDNVIRKCLDPDPARRYVSAAHLSEDLRAIAADKPARYAYEPISSRVRRGFRLYARPVASTLAFSVLMIAGPGNHYYSQYLNHYRTAEKQRIERLTNDSMEDQRKAVEARIRDDFATALQDHTRAINRLSEEPILGPVLERTLQEFETTTGMRKAFLNSEEFLASAGLLRYRVLHATRFGGDLEVVDLKGDLSRSMLPILDEFDKFRSDRENGTDRSWLTRLNPQRLELVREWTSLILFETVCALVKTNQDADIRAGLNYCRRISSVTEPELPWSALRDRLSAIIERRTVPAISYPDPRQEKSQIVCLQYARLSQLEGHSGESIKWATRAAALRPADPWVHHELALMMEQQGQYLASLDRLEIATSLAPQSPWARLDRARQCRWQGQYSQAWEDLAELRAQIRGLPIESELKPLLELESGLVEQGLGRTEASMRWFRDLIDQPDVDEPIRLLAAQALCEDIIADRRWTELEPILERFDPGFDRQTSWAVIRARRFQGLEMHQEALATLDDFIRANPDVVRAKALRVISLLKIGRSWDAVEECERIVKISSTPMNRRMLDRCRIDLLADLPKEDPRWLQTLLSLQFNDPETIRLWPSFETETIRKVVRKIHDACDDPRMGDKLVGNLENRCLLTLSVLESALCDPGAMDTLERTIAELDPSILTIRTQVFVLLSENRLDDAEDLLETGFRLSFEDPILVELRARLNFLRRDYDKALEDYDNLIRNRDIPDVRAWRAKTLARRGRWNEALSDLSRALAYDPFQPDWRITRATVWHRLGRLDLADVDLDLAERANVDNGNLNLRITMARAQLQLADMDRPDSASRKLLKGFRETFSGILTNEASDSPDSKVDTSLLPASGERAEPMMDPSAIEMMP